MFKRVPAETQQEILEKVKQGIPVVEVAKQYAVSIQIIYSWLKHEVTPHISVLEYNRLKKENEELKRIIGMVTLEMERGKKNRVS